MINFVFGTTINQTARVQKDGTVNGSQKNMFQLPQLTIQISQLLQLFAMRSQESMLQLEYARIRTVRIKTVKSFMDASCLTLKMNAIKKMESVSGNIHFMLPKSFIQNPVLIDQILLSMKNLSTFVKNSILNTIAVLTKKKLR